MEEGRGSLENKVPTLLVLNKKDLIKPGEIAKKLEVRKFGSSSCKNISDKIHMN